MVESGVGRTERRELRQSRLESGRRTEAQHGDVWQPRPPFALVRAELDEPLLQVVCESGRALVLVFEDEHPHAPGLAVPGDGESRASRAHGALLQGGYQSGEFRARARAEKGEGDVQVLARDDASAGKRPARPVLERGRNLVRKSKSEEEPETLIALDGSAAVHADMCRIGVKIDCTLGRLHTLLRRAALAAAAGVAWVVAATGCAAAGSGAPSAASRDARPALLPPGARPVRWWFAPAADAPPRRMVVAWRARRLERGEPQQGVVVAEKDGHRWRRVYAVRFTAQATVETQFGDVTGDGRSDLLLEQSMGSGACGWRRIVATYGRRTRELYRRHACDSFAIRDGALVVASGVYTPHDAHCCPTFTRATWLRWDGRRLRAVRSALYWTCVDRRCVDWRNGPLRFRPRTAASWDRTRAVATGGARPWLLARSTDGGRTWRITDAAPCALGVPVVTGRGRARVPLRNCRGWNGTWRYVTTSDFGATWQAHRFAQRR